MSLQNIIFVTLSEMTRSYNFSSSQQNRILLFDIFHIVSILQYSPTFHYIPLLSWLDNYLSIFCMYVKCHIYNIISVQLQICVFPKV